MVALLGAGYLLGFINSCDNWLAGFTGYVDPCGTILANCVPGQFQLLNSDIGDYCIDPACTVPGACDTGTQPLGTIYHICP
jgi:hypothetical protein